LDHVVARALAKDPDERYPSAGDLGRAALAAARGEPVTESERTVAIGPAAPDASAPHDATAAPGILPAHAPPTRVRAGAEPPVADQPRRRRRPHGRTLSAAIALPLAGIVTVALIMLLSGSGGRASATDTTPLSASEVHGVVDAFAADYETENGAALGQLLTDDVERVLPSGVLRSRKAVVGEYEGQFATNATESYDIDDLDVRGGPAGRASGDYRVRRAGSPSLAGHIVLAIVRDRGHARIGLIAVTPRT
jgi:serine/threonine-protein kinase